MWRFVSKLLFYIIDPRRAVGRESKKYFVKFVVNKQKIIRIFAPLTLNRKLLYYDNDNQKR